MKPDIQSLINDVAALAARCHVMEKIIIELTLEAENSAHSHRRARLGRLLSELQYAGIEQPNNATNQKPM